MCTLGKFGVCHKFNNMTSDYVIVAIKLFCAIFGGHGMSGFEVIEVAKSEKKPCLNREKCDVLFMLTNNNSARASRHFVHFFAVVAPLRLETS